MKDKIVHIPMPTKRLTVRQQSDVSAIIHRHIRKAHRSNDPRAYVIAKQEGLKELIKYCNRYDLPLEGAHFLKANFTFDVYTEYSN